MKIENDVKMMELAFKISEMSKANKRKVGAVIADSDMNVFSFGYNSMFVDTLITECETEDGESYDCVIHAEEEAIMNFLKFKNRLISTDNENLTIYVTYSPCMNCCKLIKHAGIKRVVYCNEHIRNFKIPSNPGNISPKVFLEMVGIQVIKIEY